MSIGLIVRLIMESSSVFLHRVFEKTALAVFAEIISGIPPPRVGGHSNGRSRKVFPDLAECNCGDSQTAARVRVTQGGIGSCRAARDRNNLVTGSAQWRLWHGNLWPIQSCVGCN